MADEQVEKVDIAQALNLLVERDRKLEEEIDRLEMRMLNYVRNKHEILRKEIEAVRLNHQSFEAFVTQQLLALRKKVGIQE